ncbi:MAG: glycosyltransferase family 2 protein, partial [Clostridium sp.]|nr:glycosyltransferase family 2 protein [Clostridium sp.]
MTELQSVLVPNPSVCAEESLYYHRDGTQISFDGYFNLFYIEKRKKYTALEHLELHLELRGYSRICLMHDRTTLAEHTLT